MARAARIDAIVLPRIVDAPRSAIRPASRAQALLALAPALLLTKTASPADGLDTLASLVSSVPSYAFELGHDLRETPEQTFLRLEEIT